MSQPAPTIIARDLRALGVRVGGVLLVHSSLRSLGLPTDLSAAARAEIAIQGLLEALGPTGTLLMPALSYEAVGAHNPVFDARSTPSCIGALPEIFRCRPGTLRSIHPTHSVCGVGAGAVELLADHIQSTTPVGPHSPFAKLPKVGGQILFLGCGTIRNTSMHGVEELVEPEYLYGSEIDYHIILADGTKTAMRVRSHNFKGWEQRYDRLENVMERGLRKGKVLNADCHLLEAAEMWDAALRTMRNDPLYFVERS